MYNGAAARGFNPLHIAGARRNGRARIGAGEFTQCADGTWVGGGSVNCATRGGTIGNPNPPAGGNGYRPPFGNLPPNPYNTPPSGQGGTPYVCWDGSYSDGPDFCPTQPQVGPPLAPPPPVQIPCWDGSYSNPCPPYPAPPPAANPPATNPPSGGGNGGGGQSPPIMVPNGCAPPVNVCPENQKRYTMPFVPDAGFTATVTAGSQVRFVGAPQKLFKPDRLIIASTIAPYFDIVDLRIANIPQTLSAGNIPADIFSEVSTYTMMSFDQAYPGVQIIITAQNKSSVTQTFQASLIGEAIG